MKGFIAKALSCAGIASGLFATTGCIPCYNNLVDPCYPQRYWKMAREEVKEGLGAQVGNGHVLDQTIWNHEFEAGTAKLTAGGIEHLVYLTRRRPSPDAVIYVQASHDVAYDPAAPEKYTQGKQQLDANRVDAVQKFLTAETSGSALAFTVLVHNPATPEIPAIAARNAIGNGWLTSPFIGVVPAAQGIGGFGTGAAGGGGGGGGAGGY